MEAELPRCVCIVSGRTGRFFGTAMGRAVGGAGAGIVGVLLVVRG